MPIPKVHSQSLANLLGTVGTKVEVFTATLDHISDDIRAVEKWLQASGIRVEVEHVYSTLERAVDDAALKAYLEALDNFRGDPPDPVPALRDIEALAWAPVSTGGQWRILHILRRSEGTMPGDSWAEPQVVSSRPLIETPAPTRLGIGNALEKLIEEIASMVPESYGQETFIEGELHVSDQSRSGTETGPWAGPWAVYFHKGSSRRGQDLESMSGYRRYDTWPEVLELVQRLVDSEVSLDELPRSFTLDLKVPVRLLRELRLM